MKKLKNLSIVLQMLVLLCFFLPFFPQGCESKKAEDVNQTEKSANTTNQVAKSDVSENQSKNPYNNNRKSLSERLSNKSKVLKLLLRPDNDYTGIGYTLDMLESLFGFGVAFSLFLWIIGLIVKLKDFNSILHVINITGLVLFFFTQPAMFTDTKLWGYWICLSLATLLIIYDLTLYIASKKSGYNSLIR